MLSQKLAFIFPGQGSQFVGMAKDLYFSFDRAKELFHQANDIMGFDLAELAFNGPDDLLVQTKNTQPAIFVHSYILNELLAKEGITPCMVAGHSLGEYSALTCVDVLPFDQGLGLVKIRGELMQNAGSYNKGSMAAIIGLDYITVHKLCQVASKEALVDLANFNSPEQIVISGTVAGVEKAMKFARDEGAKMVIPLNVSGAFHSPLMKPVLQDFLPYLEKVTFNDPAVPVFSNVTGQPTTEAQEIKMFLGKQLISPVLWSESIEHMLLAGAELFVEIGPGKVLTGLLKRIDKSIKAITISSLEQLENLLERTF